MPNYPAGVWNSKIINSLVIGVRYYATWLGGVWLPLLFSKLSNELKQSTMAHIEIREMSLVSGKVPLVNYFICLPNKVVILWLGEHRWAQTGANINA